jgi:peptidoglycan/LPS O-acetylase OafA/YrhL
MEINDKTRNIASLDGMRAISILLVVSNHPRRDPQPEARPGSIE